MDSISRRQIVRGAAAMAVATTLGTPSVHAQRDRQTLRFVPHAELKILDPVWTTTYIIRNHCYLVYDTLFGTDENLQIKPQMVDRTTVSPDGMKYTSWRRPASLLLVPCSPPLLRARHGRSRADRQRSA
jgi:peptide/nickel transport system substrate-binding protein